MNSITLTLSGENSSLSADYYPPIELDPDGEYTYVQFDRLSFLQFNTEYHI